MRQLNGSTTVATDSEDDMSGGLAELLPGDLARIAEVAGVEAAVRIADAFRGTSLYICGLDDLRRRARDERIRQEYDSGTPVRTLARRYNITDRAIRKILGRVDESPLTPDLAALINQRRVG